MEQNTQYETHGKIMRRVAKTDTNIYGVRRVNSIPSGHLSIVIFGGEKTNTPQAANGYAKMYEQLLKFYQIHDVRVYSAYYNFLSTNRNTERANVFLAARSKLSAKDKHTHPVDTSYISDLYDIVIKPRIVNKNGTKFPDETAMRNMRNIIIGTHCHGSVPVYTFQNMMLSDMRQLGYSPAAINSIMKNLLVIQHAPVSPLEKQKFNTLSFMSANDTRMNFHNKISEYITENNADLSTSYFSLGNFFVTHAFTYQYLDEHSITGLVPNKDQDMLTPDGATIMATERNAIINGIRAAQQGIPMPTVRDLVSPASPDDVVKPNFDTLAQNGETFMNLMRYDLHLKPERER